jgi:hypothetical protein
MTQKPKVDPGALARCPKCGILDRPGRHLCKPENVARLAREREAFQPLTVRNASHVNES